jgi:hypothetical protein
LVGIEVILAFIGFVIGAVAGMRCLRLCWASAVRIIGSWRPGIRGYGGILMAIELTKKQIDQIQETIRKRRG